MKEEHAAGPPSNASNEADSTKTEKPDDDRPKPSDTDRPKPSKGKRKLTTKEIELRDERYSKKMKVSSIFTKNPEIPQISRYEP